MWRKKCNLQANYTKRNGFFIQKPWSDTRPKRLLKENDEFSDRLWKKLKNMLFSIWFLCIRLVCLPQISGRQNQVSRERDRSISSGLSWSWSICLSNLDLDLHSITLTVVSSLFLNLFMCLHNRYEQRDQLLLGKNCDDRLLRQNH